ncbi:hypothetical protein RCL_jg12054.t1 [Rhizophagus clarus]|uniref:Uncharacterized protein n=1 Tax=Rhizophagus clarus TaxID=94130 RepID=A0A8H3L8Z6_9GLOM|nr:hypothetical protein RCL_jg12054.t1 [Rhizophagus clarus]
MLSLPVHRNLLCRYHARRIQVKRGVSVDFDDRFTTHDSRLIVYDSRFMIHVSIIPALWNDDLYVRRTYNIYQ